MPRKKCSISYNLSRTKISLLQCIYVETKSQPQLINNEINVPYLQLTTNKLKIHSTNNTDSDISLCQYFIIMVRFMFMVFHAVFNNISVLLVEETRIPGENHRPVVSHWQTLSHNVVSSTPSLSGIRTHNVSGDEHWLHL